MFSLEIPRDTLIPRATLDFIINKIGFCSRREPEEPEDASQGRDVFNEKPAADELMAASDIGNSATTSLPENVVCFHNPRCLHLF